MRVRWYLGNLQGYSLCCTSPVIDCAIRWHILVSFIIAESHAKTINRADIRRVTLTFLCTRMCRAIEHARSRVIVVDLTLELALNLRELVLS